MVCAARVTGTAKDTEDRFALESLGETSQKLLVQVQDGAPFGAPKHPDQARTSASAAALVRLRHTSSSSELAGLAVATARDTSVAIWRARRCASGRAWHLDNC